MLQYKRRQINIIVEDNIIQSAKIKYLRFWHLQIQTLRSWIKSSRRSFERVDKQRYRLGINTSSDKLSPFERDICLSIITQNYHEIVFISVVQTFWQKVQSSEPTSFEIPSELI